MLKVIYIYIRDTEREERGKFEPFYQLFRMTNESKDRLGEYQGAETKRNARGPLCVL